MQDFALGWLAVQLAVRDGDLAFGGLYLGLRSLASAVPSLGVGIFAGVLADRVDRRALLISSRIASAAVAAVATVLVITDHVNIAVLMLLSAAAAGAYVFDPPGRQAILPKVVPVRDLFSAMGLVRAAQQSAHTIGPLIAGLLIVPFGVGGVMLAMSGLVLVSIATLVPLADQPVHDEARSVSVLRSLADGVGYIRGHELLRWAVLLQIAFAILGQSFMQLLPAIAVDTLRVGARELSWMTAGVGVGALGGAFFIATVGRVERLGAVLLGMTGSVGLMLVVLGLQREIVGTVVSLIVLGALHQLFMGAHGVILQLFSPDRLRGRIMGTQSLVFMTFLPLGVLLLGALGTRIGISNAVLVSGVVVAAMSVGVWAGIRAFRDLRRTAAIGYAKAAAVGAD